MPVTNQALPGGYQLLNYRVDRQISRGGFSIVYRAFDETGAPVAIKEYLPSSLVLRTEGDIVRASSAENLTSFRYGMKCFFEEGRALAKINHPNVVRVLNFFRANETVYMVMRYERGRTLQQQIQMRQDQMSERFVRHVFMHLLNGLREVHTHKLLHLDIKPANIYLRTDGTPVLLDFGAARQTLTNTRPKLAPMYTPGFAAPEQYRDPERLGPWTDVYGAGRQHVRVPRGLCAASRRRARAGRSPGVGQEDLGGPVFGQPARSHRLVFASRPARAAAVGLCAAESDPRHSAEEAQAVVPRQPEEDVVFGDRRVGVTRQSFASEAGAILFRD
jgi:serine/threonine protein kinase